MALIKERRQFLPKSIGVVRPDTGSEFIARGASNLADSMINMSFEAMKTEARKKGVETAQAASATALRTIDPITGKPEAFKMPGNFGIAAQQAYEETLERRYIQQTETDIKTKAAELALKYQFDPNGPTLFDDELGDYIDGLVDGAIPKFTNIVNNVGGAILASNKLNLLGKQAQREREALGQSIELEIAQGIEDLQDLTRTGANTQDLEAGSGKLIDAIDRYKAGFPERATPEALNNINENLRKAEVEGLTQLAVSQAVDLNLSSGDLIAVAEYIKAPKSQSARDDVPSALLPTLDRLIASEGFADNRSTALSLFGDQESDASKREVDEAAALSSREREEQESAKTNSIITTAGLDERQSDTTKQIASDMFGDNLEEGFAKVDAYKRDIDSERPTFLQAGRSAAPLDATIDKVRKFAVEQAITSTMDGLNYQDAANFAEYIQRFGQSDVELSPEVKKKADIIINQLNPAEDFDTIATTSSRLVTQKKPKTMTAVEQAEVDFVQNTIVPSSAAGRQAAGNIVARSLGMENLTPDYFGTSASRPNDRANPAVKSFVNRGNPPQPLVDFLDFAASGGPLSEEAATMAVNHWADHAFNVDADGNVTNRLLLSGMDPKTNAVLQSAFYLRTVREQPVSEIIKDLIQANQNPTVVENNIMTAFSGNEFSSYKSAQGKLDFYIRGKSYGNARIQNTITPLVRTLVASGVGYETINNQVNNVVEKIFAPTTGLVTDPMSPIGGRSVHALSSIFPDQDNKDLFIAKVSKTIFDEAPGYVFSPAASGGLLVGQTGPYKKTKIATLVPISGQGVAGTDVLFMASHTNEYGEIVPIQGKNGLILIPASAVNVEISQRNTANQILANIEGAATSQQIAKRMREMQTGRVEQMSIPAEDQ